MRRSLLAVLLFAALSTAATAQQDASLSAAVAADMNAEQIARILGYMPYDAANGGTKLTQLPDAAGNSPVYGPDGAVNAVLGWMPHNTFPTQVPILLPGVYGAGGTMLCTDPGHTSVDCTVAMKGGGNFNVGNGSGWLFQVADPGAAVSAYPQFIPGTLTDPLYPNVAILNILQQQQAAQSGLQIRVTGGGVGIGSGKNQAANDGSIAIGKYNHAFGAGSLVSGTSSYDYGNTGARCHQSFGQPASITTGSNQYCEQGLWATTAGSAQVKLTVNGSQTVNYSGQAPSVQSGGHGSFRGQVECTNTTNGDQAIWFLQGSFSRNNKAITLTYTSGTGASLIASGSLSTMTLAMGVDTTYNIFYPMVTPPTGNSSNIGCTAWMGWMQRLT